MSNGVEVIVADGKSTLPGEPNFFRILTSKPYNKPYTLAPSTINNVYITLGHNGKIDNIPESAILNRFVTKTCLTTYTYLTTYMHNGSTTIESREKVISNIATEERNTQNVTPLIASDMTFFKTPNLKVGEFSTTYTYYNTIMDEDVPIVATSKHVVVNTITAADDYLKLIQPSPQASPVYETNTYYSTVDFSKTIQDEEATKVINTQDVITQVIVTESLPHGRTPNSYNHDIDDLSPSQYDDIEITNYSQKTNALDIQPTRIDIRPDKTPVPLHIYATKTYMTTFTYFTTLLHNDKNKVSSTVVDSHTRVIENVITESIPSSLIPSQILTSISKNLIVNDQNDLKTMITLRNGQKLEITAANIMKPIEFQSASTTKLVNFESNDLDVAANDLSPTSALLASEDAEEPIAIEPDASEENIVSHEEEAALVADQQTSPSEEVKVKPISTSSGGTSGITIPGLLSGINIDSFSALGPVINAMAGLLQNNFGSEAKVKTKVVHEIVPIGIPPNPPQALHMNQDNIDAILRQTESKNNLPLYIPVRGSDGSVGNFPNIEAHAHNNKNPAAIMGDGIHISPGEVITANSDVIIGRPTGIGPKVPVNIEEKPFSGQPPPFIPLQSPQRKPSFVKDIKTNQNQIPHKIDDYVGPVPPKGPHNLQHKPIPINSLPRQPAPQNLQKIQPIMPPILRPSHGNNNNNVVITRPLDNNNQNHFVKVGNQINVPGNSGHIIHSNRPTIHKNHQHHPSQGPLNHHQNIGPSPGPPIHHHQNIGPSPGPPNHHQNIGPSPRPSIHLSNIGPSPGPPQHHQNIGKPQSDLRLPNVHHNHNFNVQPTPLITNDNRHLPPHIQIQPSNEIITGPPPHVSGHLNNIIEIKKIPEVYSTDLPAITVPNKITFGHHHNQNHNHHHDHDIITQNLPEVLDRPNGQPLLVDLQPSQVANVIIPHGSSSVLVFGGVQEPHKTGHYINDTSPYENEKVGIKHTVISDISPGDKNHVQTVGHYDVKDNIILASDSPIVQVHSVTGNNHLSHVSNHIQVGDGPVNNGNGNLRPGFVENVSPLPLPQTLPDIQNQIRQKQIEREQFEHNQRKQQYEAHQKKLQQQKLENELRIRQQQEQEQKIKEQREYEIRVKEQREHEKRVKEQREFEQRLKEQRENELRIKYEREQQQKELQQRLEHEQRMKHQYEQEQKRIQQQKLENELRQKMEIQRLENDKRLKQQYEQQQQKVQAEIRMKEQFEKQKQLFEQQQRQKYEEQERRKQEDQMRQKHFMEQQHNRLKQQQQQQQQQQQPQIINIHHNYPNIYAPNFKPQPQNPQIPHYRPPVILQHTIPVDQPIVQRPSVPAPVPTAETNKDNQVYFSHNINLPHNSDSAVSDDDGQESMIHPIRPMGQPHVTDDVVQEDHVEISNFNHELLSTEATPVFSSTTVFPPQSTPANNFYSTIRQVFNKTTKLVSITTDYPHLNQHFENLPKLVNELQPQSQSQQPAAVRPPRPFLRPPQSNKFVNTVSHIMQPPLPQSLPSQMPPKYKNPNANGNSNPNKSNPNKSIFKVSMSIDPKPDSENDVQNNLQTEEPFDPKYTKPLPTDSPTFEPKTTQASTTQESTTEPVKINRNPVYSTRVKVLTTLRPITLRIPPIQLNFSKNKTKNEETNDIFDTKESQNPHNSEYIEDLMPPTKNYHTIVRQPTVKYNQTTVRPVNPIKLEIQTTSNRPPSTSYIPEFESIISNTGPPKIDTTFIAKQRPSYVPSNRYRTTILAPKSSAATRKTTEKLTTERTTTEELTTEEETTATTTQNRKTTGQMKNITDREKPVTVEESKTEPTTSQDEIMIGGSDEEEVNASSVVEPSSTVSFDISPTQTRPKYPPRDKIKFQTPALNVNEQRKIVISPSLNRSKLFNRDSLFSITKFVTNTKTITLSTTKTEVINRSHGVPITTTKVHTSTIFETVTETETLLKPTTVTSIKPTATYTSVVYHTSLTTPGPNSQLEYEEEEEEQEEEEDIIHGTFGNLDDLDLDEFIINSDEENSIKKVNHKYHDKHGENESIFVVMTDKKKGGQVDISKSQAGIIKMDNSIIHPSIYNEVPDDNNTFSNEISDVSRDEEDSNDGAGHILLGGILIASPPHLNKDQLSAVANVCEPECKTSMNEVCQRTEGIMRCICGPGFARMFPDRPCKPIYTYFMKIALARNGKERLAFDESLNNRKSTNYTDLAKLTHDGIDRMLMQSDLRDIYHSVRVMGFNLTKDNNGVIGKLFVKLSENSDEQKLQDTIKKYLRHSNHNLGGTQLYAAPDNSELVAYDFDECETDRYHDCSEHSHCFNLQGTYTCGCKEGFTDQSENAIYPGRICMPEQKGCEKCHYHGTCFTKTDDVVLCECFQWYTGKNCQINLKILLFVLLIVGTTLFTLLMICIIVTCAKKGRVNQNSTLAPAINVLQRRISAAGNRSTSSKMDKKAMIPDTSSEASEESEVVPYFRKKASNENLKKIDVEKIPKKQKKKVTTQNPMGSFSKATTVDQQDRSLTVMIPRAKYHPSLKQGNLLDVDAYKSKSSSNTSMNINQTKLLNYLDASPSTTKTKKNVPCEKPQYKQTGALVSAGFKVSATVGSSNAAIDKSIHDDFHESLIKSHMDSKYYGVHKVNSTTSEQPSKLILDDKSQISVVRKSYSHGNLIDSMNDWLELGKDTDLNMSEARSYDETTIQAPTKAVRNIYFKDFKDTQSSHANHDEVNTMAERDLGSTVLLPHTHLYKPTTDRGSDISGFDSL